MFCTGVCDWSCSWKCCIPLWQWSSGNLLFRCGGYSVWAFPNADDLSAVFSLWNDGCVGGNPSRSWVCNNADAGITGRSLRSACYLDFHHIPLAPFAGYSVYVLPHYMDGHPCGTSDLSGICVGASYEKYSEVV